MCISGTASNTDNEQQEVQVFESVDRSIRKSQTSAKGAHLASNVIISGVGRKKAYNRPYPAMTREFRKKFLDPRRDL